MPQPVKALVIQEGSLKARKVNDEVANSYPGASLNLQGNSVNPEHRHTYHSPHLPLVVL